MKLNVSTPVKQPFSLIASNRALIVLVVLLALLAGYFHAKASTLEKLQRQTDSVMVE